MIRSLLLDLTPPIMARALRRFRKRTPAQVIADCQARYRLYDRFLPVICRHIPAGWIVDVGANVGTTAKAMAKECDNPILCIEGYPEYFGQLLENVKGLPVRCVRALVGTAQFGGSLVRLGGTAKLVRAATESDARPLDAILQEAEISLLDIALLKTDTDGCDADVILSAKETLRGSEPLLFCENAFSDEIEEREFNSAYEYITKLGYQHFWVFDNFGNLMLSECSYAGVCDLNRYVLSQNRHACTRTIFYVEVLAATDRHLVNARNAINDYQTNMIEH